MKQIWQWLGTTISYSSSSLPLLIVYQTFCSSSSSSPPHPLVSLLFPLLLFLPLLIVFQTFCPSSFSSPPPPPLPLILLLLLLLLPLDAILSMKSGILSDQSRRRSQPSKSYSLIFPTLHFFGINLFIFTLFIADFKFNHFQTLFLVRYQEFSCQKNWIIVIWNITFSHQVANIPPIFHFSLFTWFTCSISTTR